jgi:hypothetical protein
VRRRWRRAWFAAAVAGTLLVGCERAAVRPSYPPDPLFLSKKPVRGNAEKARPALAYTEPAVPPLPASALASAPRERLGTRETGEALTQGGPALSPGPTTSTSAKLPQSSDLPAPN